MYLTHYTYEENCGVIGELSNIKTSNGVYLHVGDVVTVKNILTGKIFVEIIRWSNAYEKYIINGFGFSTSHDLQTFMAYNEVTLKRKFDSEFIKDEYPYKVSKFKSVKNKPKFGGKNQVKYPPQQLPFDLFVSNLVIEISKTSNKKELRSLLIRKLNELEQKDL